MRDSIAGATNYKNQSLREIVKDLKEMVDYSEDVLKQNKGLEKETMPPDLKWSFLEIVSFADKLVELSRKHISKVKKGCPTLFCIQSLKEMGRNAHELNLNIGKIWNNSYCSRYGDASLESVKYCELRDYIVSMIDLNNIGFELEERYFKNGKPLCKKKEEEVVILRPNIYGIGVNLKKLWKKIIKK